MPHRILVPLDGSSFAEHAVPIAIGIARRWKIGLELVTVDRPPPTWMAPELPVLLAEGHDVPNGMRYLESVKHRLPDDVPCQLTRHQGTAATWLLRTIQEARPTLVVMSTHGRGGFSRFWLGSVADRIVRESPVPVLLVKPPTIEPDMTKERHFPRVIVPLDGSRASEEILSAAVAIAGTEDVDYTLVRVLSPVAEQHPGATADPGQSREQTAPEALLREAAERLRGMGATVQTRVLVHSNAATGIVEFADSIEARLIAMTTHARDGLTRYAMGSVADKVLRSSSCPVLLLHPHHAEAMGFEAPESTKHATSGSST